MELVGERFYIKATAVFTDIDTGESVTNVAYAREEETKKGMDGSRITGTASSYARKYCLNGLFLIDDTKDADTDEYQHQQSKGEKAPESPINITSVSDNGLVRYINGVQCQIKDKNGTWHDVELMAIKQLEPLLSDDKFVNAHSAIRTTINAKLVK